MGKDNIHNVCVTVQSNGMLYHRKIAVFSVSLSLYVHCIVNYPTYPFYQGPNTHKNILSDLIGFSIDITNHFVQFAHIHALFAHSIQNCRLALSSTSSTESSTDRLTIVSGSNGGSSSSSRSQIDAYDDPYANPNASSSGINTLSTTNTPKCDTLPSTSAKLLQPISHSVRDLLASDEAKRLKLDQKFDIDDTCSNDAFIFNACLKGNPLKSNQKTATVPCNASK